jgi:predicted DNA-binding protein (MmcQ/YjbR family)
MSKTIGTPLVINDDLPDKVLKELIDHFYNLILNSLTKKINNEII